MTSLSKIRELITSELGEDLLSADIAVNELTCEVSPTSIKSLCAKLRDTSQLQFDQLIDLCGMDYDTYGEGEEGKPWDRSRYAVVYHLLSVTNNVRIRVRASLDDDQPTIDSVIDIWPAADWFEREAFDLYGIIFHGHPDLRRLLTDYGFIGHPFRKDFPLSGHVEMHYDEEKGRVVYEPVEIDDRILVPRTIRKDSFVKSTRSGSETGG